MDRLRSRLAVPTDDAGFTLIEVMVALLVFTIAATGLTAGATAIVRITADSRARQIATGVAAAELDRARAAADPQKVLSRSYSTGSTADPTYVHADDPTHVYQVDRTVSSVTADGVDAPCGTNANFGYRRVSVTVSWPSQLATTQAVRSDTILAPAAPVTDAGTGAISVKVVGSDGQARSGVGVTITPTSGGAALPSQPDPTDADGCAYAGRVVPGVYSVSLSKAGYIDTGQQSAPAISTTVVAGSTSGVPVTYDAQAKFITNYAKNYTGTGTVQLPTNLKTAFIPDLSAQTIGVKAASDGATVPLYPGGYSAVAGEFADAQRNTTCASMDPLQWAAGKVSGVKMAQGVRASAGATSGQTATFGSPLSTTSIPMGVVKVTGVPGLFLTARSATATGTGNPGCATAPADLTFGQVGLTGSAYLALPYGTWTIQQGLALGVVTLAVPGGSVSVLTNNDANGVSSSGGTTTVTLDPRSVAP